MNAYMVVTRSIIKEAEMPDAATFQYELDGQIVTTDDAVVSGRKIRASGGLNPASDYLLIEIGDVSSRSLGLEEEVNLTQSAPPAFRSFKGDRVYSLTINERGFEWGADEISATDVRRYAAIPEDHELILDSKRDRLIEDDDVVRLKSEGVERILSRPAEPICIIVNTIEEYVRPGRITFEQLAKLAKEIENEKAEIANMFGEESATSAESSGAKSVATTKQDGGN